MAWTNLKEVFKAVGDASVLFPPLQTVLFGVTAIMDSIDVRRVSESLFDAQTADCGRWPHSVLKTSTRNL
jgi:hypothetical protein